jgi:molecular chaperone GrpE
MSDKPKKKTDNDTLDEAQELQIKLDELTTALQRERADAVNLRRRHEEELATLRIRVRANVVADLLPVIDNLERALKHVPTFRHPELVSGSPSDRQQSELQEDIKKYDDYVKGVQGVVKQFEKTLSDLGVERIKTVGEPFNPELHEAISMEEGEGDKEIISEELQAGYKLGDEVIRHAMVRVKTQ